MKNILKKFKLRLQKKHPERNQPAGLSKFLRVYCIGDIHGRYDLLVRLHQMILEDAKNFQYPVQIIYLGDYIDRGPDSMRVIDCLLANPFPDYETHYLLGNHEQVFLEFIHNYKGNQTAAWLGFGGLATLLSYDVRVMGIPNPAIYRQMHADLMRNLPVQHVHFLEQLQPSYQLDGYFFAHAGIRPGVKLAKQSVQDLLWIREQFLGSERNHEKVIVHGHTVTAVPEVKENRIGIDTGAYGSGVLTCLVLEGEHRRFLTTEA